MQLKIYYENVYKLDMLHKYNNLVSTKKIVLAFKKKYSIKTYIDFIILELILNQRFCLLQNKVTLRKYNYWIFITNCLSALVFKPKYNMYVFTYLQNIFLFKNLYLKRETLILLLSNITI